MERFIITTRIKRNHQRKKQRKLRNGVIGTIIIGGSFFGGSYVQADSDFMSQIVNSATGEINEATHQKREEIISNVESNVTGQIEEQLQPIVNEKKEEYVQELQEYADSKLKNITETGQFDNFETMLEEDAKVIMNRHKNAIDEAINNAFYE